MKQSGIIELVPFSEWASPSCPGLFRSKVVALQFHTQKLFFLSKTLFNFIKKYSGILFYIIFLMLLET